MSKIKMIMGGLLLLLLSPAFSLAAEVAVIVHEDNPLSTISKGDLSRIYKGRMTSWPNGELIVVVNGSRKSKAKATFYKTVLKTKTTQKFYLPGSPIPFRTLVKKSTDDMVEFISSNEKAIGYVAKAELPGGANGFKVIKVIR